MEFQAYPAHAHGSKAAGYKATALKLQNTLHSGESLVLPILLLLAGMGAVLYEHVNHERPEESNRNFLALIVVTMLPLAFLEKEILSCTDPLSVMSKFSGKLLLSHACFLFLRVPQAYWSQEILSPGFLSCFGAAVGACILCVTVYRMRSVRAVFHENWDVWSVCLLGLAAAAITEVFTWCYYEKFAWYPRTKTELVASIVMTGAMYMEILAFVPAVMLVCRFGKRPQAQSDQSGDAADTRMRAFALSAFLLAFYFFEDVFTAWEARELWPVAMGHLAHFFLLMDFACYLLSHLYDPAKFEKLVGALRDIFAEQCAV